MPRIARQRAMDCEPNSACIRLMGEGEVKRMGVWEALSYGRVATLHLAERLLEKLPRQLHMLFDIRLQMPGACLPVVRRVADAAGQEDEFF